MRRDSLSDGRTQPDRRSGQIQCRLEPFHIAFTRKAIALEAKIHTPDEPKAVTLVAGAGPGAKGIKTIRHPLLLQYKAMNQVTDGKKQTFAGLDCGRKALFDPADDHRNQTGMVQRWRLWRM